MRALLMDRVYQARSAWSAVGHAPRRRCSCPWLGINWLIMLSIVFTGWKWLWIPLLALVSLVALIFLTSILYFVYIKFVRHSSGSLTENLDKEEAMPRIPRSHS